MESWPLTWYGLFLFILLLLFSVIDTLPRSNSQSEPSLLASPGNRSKTLALEPKALQVDATPSTEKDFCLHERRQNPTVENTCTELLSPSVRDEHLVQRKLKKAEKMMEGLPKDCKKYQKFAEKRALYLEELRRTEGLVQTTESDVVDESNIVEQPLAIMSSAGAGQQNTVIDDEPAVKRKNLPLKLSDEEREKRCTLIQKKLSKVDRMLMDLIKENGDGAEDSKKYKKTMKKRKEYVDKLDAMENDIYDGIIDDGRKAMNESFTDTPEHDASFQTIGDASMDEEEGHVKDSTHGTSEDEDGAEDERSESGNDVIRTNLTTDDFGDHHYALSSQDESQSGEDSSLGRDECGSTTGEERQKNVDALHQKLAKVEGMIMDLIVEIGDDAEMSEEYIALVEERRDYVEKLEALGESEPESEGNDNYLSVNTFEDFNLSYQDDDLLVNDEANEKGYLDSIDFKKEKATSSGSVLGEGYVN